MRNYSWYTIVHPAYEGWPAPPLYLVVNPDGTPEEVDGNRTCSIEYKPNRKGGYNRKKNRLENLQMLSVYGYSLRRIVKRDLKFSLNKKKINKMRFLKLGTVIELSEDEVIKIEDAEDGRK